MSDVLPLPSPAAMPRDGVARAFDGLAARARGRHRRRRMIQASRFRSDLRLVRAALRGRRRAVDLLVERLACIPAMVRSKHARLGMPLDGHALDDVVQSTMAAVWSKLAEFEGRSTIETWCYGFCVNELFKGIHRRRSDLQRQENLELEPAAPPADDDPVQSFEVLHESLGRLGGAGERVIRLKHFEGLTFEQIGLRLDISSNTAKTHYYRGLKRMKHWVTPHWSPEEL